MNMPHKSKQLFIRYICILIIGFTVGRQSLNQTNPVIQDKDIALPEKKTIQKTESNHQNTAPYLSTNSNNLTVGKEDIFKNKTISDNTINNPLSKAVSVDRIALKTLDDEVKSGEIKPETIEILRSALLAYGRISEYYDYISRIPDSVKNKVDLLIDGLKFHQEHSLDDVESLSKLLSESTRLFNQNPQNSNLASSLIDSLEKVEQIDDAIEIAGSAAYNNPQNPFLSYRLGMLYLQKGDDNNAGYYFSEASSISPEYKQLITRGGYLIGGQ